MSKRAEQKALEAFPVKKVPYYGLTCSAVSERDANLNKRCVFEMGYKQAEKDLGWHSVDESLPPINEDVIVLNNNHGLTLPCPLMISFAHRVDKDETITIDGKPYKPKSYNGWNIPGVKFWMPCPEIPDEE